MKKMAIMVGILFSLSSFAVITPVEKPAIFYPMDTLRVGKDKKALCKNLTEKEAQRQKFTKGKSKQPAPLNVCESSSIHVTLEDKSSLLPNNIYLSTEPLAYASGAGGALALLVETKAGLHAVELAPIVQATAEEKENQRLTILSTKLQNVVSSGIGEELIIQFSVTTKNATQSTTKESFVMCGVDKALSCLMPIRIAESTTLSDITTSWRLSYEFSANKVTLAPAEVNGTKKTDKSGLSSSIINKLGTWEIPL